MAEHLRSHTLPRYNRLVKLKFKNDPRALCIGNFDGVHKGHQALLDAALARSPHVVVLTFEPHPRTVFQPEVAPFLITPAPFKNRLLRRFGATEIITWPFSKDLAIVPADLFVEHVIIKQTQAAHVIVGEDFRFGKDRAGDIALLQSYADKGKFELTVVPLNGEGEAKYSSTSVRDALARGDIDEASRILGWPYAIEETVIKGDQRGRELGFPTANQKPAPHVMVPAYGVYASFVEIDGQRYQGVSNIGIRPMFEVKEPLIETYVFDFDGDLYGRVLHVEPVAKLRDEARYEGLDALIAQIREDCNAARALLTSRS